MQNEINLKVFADYFQWYIQDENAGGDMSAQWTDEAAARLLAITEDSIAIGTARNMIVRVCIKTFDSEPPFLADPENEICKINECDLDVKSGKIMVMGCTDYVGDATRIELQNGIYRARIYYGNLDKISEDGLDGADYYKVHLWLTNKHQGLKIIKGSHNDT